MAKPKMKAITTPKVASYTKTGKRSTGKKPDSGLKKMSKTLRKDGKNSAEKGDDKKEIKSLPLKKTTTKGVKRKNDETKGEESDSKKAKIEELSFKDRKNVRRQLKNNSDLTRRAKVIWNTVREKSCSKEKRIKLLNELCGVIKTKVFELLSSHDTVRVIQCCIQFGSSEQRQDIFNEVKDADKIILLAKGKYSKHFILKMLRYGTKAHRSFIMSCFHGQVCKLVRHKEAAEILERAYNNHADAKQRSALLEEFYGPRFAIFKEESVHSLADILNSQPETAQGIMEHLLKTLSQVIEKSVIKHSIVHKALLDFLVHAPVKMKTELIEGMREVVVQILHTHDGARAAMHCLWHGTAKDRKAIIKSFKTFVCKICKEEFGHMVLLAMFDCVDDTALVRKVLLQELVKSLSDIAKDQYGRKVLLYLLSPRNRTHFHPVVVELLKTGDGNAVSKKDVAIRRRELLQAVSEPLLQFVSENAGEMAFSKSSCLLMVAVLCNANGSKESGYRAIASLAAEEFIPSMSRDNENHLNDVHIIEHPAGHLVIRQLLQHQKTTMKETEEVPVLLFSAVLLETVSDANLQSWSRVNRGALILASLVDCGVEETRQRVKDILKPIVKNLGKMKTNGAKVLMERLLEKQ